MDHSKIIVRIARETLAPLGVFQKGSSRTWLDDRGWWISVIEFQPSSWNRGSYLNVGAMWLWHEKDYFSFDVGAGDSGSRVENFVEFTDQHKFETDILEMAVRAKAEILKLRSRFSTVRHAARYLSKRVLLHGDIRTELAAGIALGYIGKTFWARRLFKRIASKKPAHDWQITLRDNAQSLAQNLDAPDDFRRAIRAQIFKTREVLKLPARPDLGLDKEEIVS